MAVAAFSEDGKYFSVISKDGKLKIWDTETNVLKQEYTPDLHLTSPPTCLQWISLSQFVPSPHKGSKRKSSINNTDQETKCIALGTSNGKILLYSVAEAKIETVLFNEKNTEIMNNKITSLDWHRNYGLFSCNKQNLIFEWDIHNSTVRKKYNIYVDSKNKQSSQVSAIKIIPHNLNSSAKFLVAASWQIRLWRLLDDSAVVIKALGHNAAQKALLALATFNNRSWLIEGSQNERLLSFWDVTITSEHIPQVNGEDTSPTKKQRKLSTADTSIVSTPTYNFVLEDAPKIIDVNLIEETGTKLMLVTATRSGVVHYYEHILNGASTKPIKPSVTLHVTTADAHPLPLQCCQLPPHGNILLGYLNGVAMSFERVTPDLKSKTQVLIRGDSKGGRKKNKQTNEVNKVRGDSRGDDVTYVEPMGGVSRKRPTPGGKIEVPMEARLANLALDTKSRSKSAVNQNLTKLLVQGLHSKDKGLILTVLQNDDPQVAFRTVSHLPADYVPLLLDQLADMATRKTSQCACACTWATATLRAHAALLLAAAGSTAADQLTKLMTIFTHRQSQLCRLLNLRGRIDLTIAQRNPGEDTQTDQEALLQYNDTSSDEEMEIERYQSENSDAESWGDNPDSADSGDSGDEPDDGDGDAGE